MTPKDLKCWQKCQEKAVAANLKIEVDSEEFSLYTTRKRNLFLIGKFRDTSYLLEFLVGYEWGMCVRQSSE